MTKRRRLLNSPLKKHKSIENKEKEDDEEETVPEREVRTARGRLMGALLEALEGDSSDDSETPARRIRYRSPRKQRGSTEDQGQYSKQYVLKLFDRSVDLSQFEEDSPLYPICRAWIANQPKSNYKELQSNKEYIVEDKEDSVELPGPEGPPISKIPELLPEQKARNKTNINLNYNTSTNPLYSREQLLNFHLNRWSAIRRAWLEQAAKVETRYNTTQEVLNKITNIK